MQLWLKRELVRRLIGPLAFGVISVLLGLFYLWVLGSVFSGNNFSANNPKVYKNYVERSFVDEVITEKEIYEKRMAEEILFNSQDPGVGTFVVIPISGAILGDNAQRIWDQLYITARITDDVKAIIFLIDSPGGGVTESDRLYEEIRKIKTRGIKVVSFVNSLSASGAYYITVESDKIVSSPTGITGSIGVIWRLINMKKLSQKIGVSEEVIKSSGMKDIGSMFKEMSGNERVVLQRVVDHSYGRFKSIVQKERGLSNSQIELVSTGAVWHSEDAKMLGLVDEIGYMNRAVGIAKELTGVKMPIVVQYEEEVTLWDIFGTRSPLISLVKNLNSAVDNPDIFSSELLYMWIP